MERKTLKVSLRDKIRNIVIRQKKKQKKKTQKKNTTNKQTNKKKNPETDAIQYVAYAKWKWAGHIALMKGNRWTIGITVWQIQGIRSVERQTVVGEMAFWDNMGQYEEGQQRTEKVGGLRGRATS